MEARTEVRGLDGGAEVWSGRFSPRAHAGSGSGSVHAHAVVLLVLRGESSVRHRGHLRLHAGDVHLIPPGDPHRVEGGEDLEVWAVGFHPAALGSASEAAQWLGPMLRVREGCHPVLRPTPAQRRRLLRWMRLLAEETSTSEPAASAAAPADGRAVRALLQLVLVELERIAVPVPVSAGTGAADVAKRALTWIERHCTEPISLTDVAAAVRRSAAHVEESVRAHTGRSVGEWILECRMAEARRRLQSTDERVDVIAERVGYRDVTHFIRLFRRHHGVTPAAWRRQREVARAPAPAAARRKTPRS